MYISNNSLSRNFLNNSSSENILRKKSHSSQKKYQSGLFKLTALSCFILSANAAIAADEKTVTELNAEIAQLRAENAALKSNQNFAPTSSSTSVETPSATQSLSIETNVNLPVAAATKPASADEVLVVAQKISHKELEKIKEIPTSISIVTGDELEKQQTSSFRDILKKIGNIKWGGSSTNPTTTALALRGVGYLGSGGALSFDGSINTSVDGVPYILPNMAVFNSYYDIETVDVARGPQGTTGGYTASLGKISFTTKAPSFIPEAEGSITFGQLNTIITRGVISGPIIPDVLAWRGTFYREQADGAFENKYYHTVSNGGNEVTYGNTDRTYGKVQFLYTPTADFKALFSVDITPNSKEYGISSNGGFLPRAVPDYYDSLDPTTGNIIYNNRAVDQSSQDTGRLTRRWFSQNASYTYADNYLKDAYRAEHYPIANDTHGVAAKLDWNLNDYTLTSITAWRDYHFDFGSPNFSLPTPFEILVGPSSGLGYFKQTTQEFKLASPVGQELEYQVGLFYADVFKTSGGDGRGNKFGSDAGAYYASKAQYDRLDADGFGRYLLSNSLNGLASNSYAEKDDTSKAIYGNFKWNATDRLSFTTGLRISDEERRNDFNYNLIYNQGYAAELNPVAVNGVQLGGFNSTATGQLDTTDPTQIALANATAKKYFGVDKYSNLTAAQARLIADAKAIRLGRISGLYGPVAAEPFSDTLYTANFSPSYKFTENQTGYVSWQHGEKAGVSQIVGATKNGGTSLPTKAEINNSYELGLKSTFFNNSLTVNSTLFYQDIKDYIANQFVYDPVQTAINAANNDPTLAYLSAIGNVPKVRSKGVELDVNYTYGGTNIRVSGSYNDARYIDFKNAGKPLELGGTTTAYYDVSGKRLPGVGPTTFNIFAEHSWSVFDSKEIFANANYNYTSSYLTDPALSRYSKVDSYGLTDIGIGYGTTDKKFQVSLLVKNLFNVEYGYQPLWNIAIPSTPRWAGITLSGKL